MSEDQGLETLCAQRGRARCIRLPEDGRNSRPKHVGEYTTNIKSCSKLIMQTSMYVSSHPLCCIFDRNIHIIDIRRNCRRKLTVRIVFWCCFSCLSVQIAGIIVRSKVHLRFLVKRSPQKCYVVQTAVFRTFTLTLTGYMSVLSC